MSRELQRILLVEDDPDIAVLAQIGLEEIGGFTLRHVADPLEAEEAARAFRPDLAIFDYRMPDLTGIELLERFRGQADLAGLPVVFMTASLMPQHVRRLREQGALDVIGKPFDPLTLADRVRAIWDAL